MYLWMPIERDKGKEDIGMSCPGALANWDGPPKVLEMGRIKQSGMGKGEAKIGCGGTKKTTPVMEWF